MSLLPASAGVNLREAANLIFNELFSALAGAFKKKKGRLKSLPFFGYAAMRAA